MTKMNYKNAFADEADLKEFQDLVFENAGWVDTIGEAITTAAKARENLRTKVSLYWKRISLKYPLDKHKLYEINSETGEITLSKNQEVKK